MPDTEPPVDPEMLERIDAARANPSPGISHEEILREYGPRMRYSIDMATVTGSVDREWVVREALATVRLEGLEPRPEVIQIMDRYARGEISYQEAGQEIHSFHERLYGSLRLPRY